MPYDTAGNVAEEIKEETIKEEWSGIVKRAGACAAQHYERHTVHL